MGEGEAGGEIRGKRARRVEANDMEVSRLACVRDGVPSASCTAEKRINMEIANILIRQLSQG